jgi:hypothetical protein
MPSGQCVEELSQQGWSLVESVYAANHLSRIHERLARALQTADDAVREREGAVYAARNLLDLCPDLIGLWETPELVQLVSAMLGPQAGLVRALYFDKPPEQTWALPWHKDLLIAIGGCSAAPGYSTPRQRAGVWHSEPPLAVLEQMLTLRIHLDPMTGENGPLEVLSGSHRSGKQLVIGEYPRTAVTAGAGSVLAMRPLLTHASGRSSPDCTRHRRVVHLEFCGLPQLPGGMRWHAFHPLAVKK